jgi:hypothetical protein
VAGRLLTRELKIVGKHRWVRLGGKILVGSGIFIALDKVRRVTVGGIKLDDERSYPIRCMWVIGGSWKREACLGR